MGKKWNLKVYRFQRQHNPLKLPVEPQLELEVLFNELKRTVEVPAFRTRTANIWISDKHVCLWINAQCDAGKAI